MSALCMNSNMNYTASHADDVLSITEQEKPPHQQGREELFIKEDLLDDGSQVKGLKAQVREPGF